MIPRIRSGHTVAHSLPASIIHVEGVRDAPDLQRASQR